MPDIPHLPSEWPPTVYQLAEIATKTHWVLEQLAYDLPRGVSRERLDTVAEALEGLAGLLRRHVADDGPPEP